MIAILSDIHANLPALEAVLTDMPKVRSIWVLGDMVGEFPYPIEVLDRLMNLNVAAVAGNRELDLLEMKRGGHADWFHKSQFGCLAWTHDVLLPHHWAFLSSLEHPRTVSVGDHQAILAHGSPNRVRDHIFSLGQAKGLFDKYPQTLMATGHTHKIGYYLYEGKTFIGAGSVGLALDGIGGVAAYALYDENTGKAAFRHVSYNVDKVIRDTKASDMYDRAPDFCNADILELLTGRHHVLSLIDFVQGYAEKALGEKECDIPDDIWREAAPLWDRKEWLKGRMR